MTTQPPEFIEFPKIARLSRDCVITEKIDGTNAQVFITDDGDVFAGSRNRWLTTAADNFGFAAWVESHREELLTLGPGRHFGEWWGSGIQRGYGLSKGERRWSLFNALRWDELTFRWAQERKQRKPGDPVPEFVAPPSCCHVVPVMHRGGFVTGQVDLSLRVLLIDGSLAAPGFMNTEGVVVFHIAGNVAFKKTIEKDEEPKSAHFTRR